MTQRPSALEHLDLNAINGLLGCSLLPTGFGSTGSTGFGATGTTTGGGLFGGGTSGGFGSSGGTSVSLWILLVDTISRAHCIELCALQQYITRAPFSMLYLDAFIQLLAPQLWRPGILPNAIQVVS